MPYLQYRDQRVTLTQADQVIGAFDGAALRVPGDDPAARAVVRIAADGTGIIRRDGQSSVVFVNGVQLGAEPSPLLHGDKVELAGVQLHYGDDAKGGSTQYIDAASVAAQVRAAGGPKKATSATGGRLVSLVDGREYTVPDGGVTFGREIGNDIVIASAEVSRRHAQILPGDNGYILKDLSTNGVLVNGARVEAEQVLGRGDVIRIATEEFRFYADKAKEPAAVAPPSASTPPVPPAPAVDAPPPVAEVAASAPAPPSATPPVPATPEPSVPPPAPPAPAAPAAPAPKAAEPAAAASLPPSEAPTEPKPVRPSVAREPLATLEVVNEGPMKGTKYSIFTPLTNVGRGAHNDVAITDDSVSDSHAKILRKEGQWYVVDQGSTNGTYVGGRRVQGEQHLVGAPDVRFGNVKLTFRPSATAADAGGGTRAIAALNVEQARRMSTHQKPPAAPSPSAPAAAATHKPEKPIVIPEVQVPEKKKGCAAVIAFVIAAAAGAGMLAVLLIAVRG
ncbi:MAG: FHA domain-containing protein [Gemmatimonadota bacterium]|nr:FHA domain-containing protein [Gemmatimonadota bacterium]